MLAIGCDHAAYEFKEEIKKWLVEEKGLQVKDFGCYSPERFDYPISAQRVCKAVVSGECEKGILICGTGVGISIAANKVKGVRAVCCSEAFSAKLSREHNDANVLCFGARVVGLEVGKNIIETWLDASFQGGRHQERVHLITAIENGEDLG